MSGAAATARVCLQSQVDFGLGPRCLGFGDTPQSAVMRSRTGHVAFLDIDSVPLTLVAAPDHRLASSVRVSSEDLHGERLLVNVPGCSFRMAADKIIGPETERVEAGGVLVMRAWAEQRLGIALLPEFAVSTALESGKLAKLAFRTPQLNLRLVWRGDQNSSPGLRDLLYAASA